MLIKTNLFETITTMKTLLKLLKVCGASAHIPNLLLPTFRHLDELLKL